MKNYLNSVKKTNKRYRKIIMLRLGRRNSVFFFLNYQQFSNFQHIEKFSNLCSTQCESKIMKVVKNLLALSGERIEIQSKAIVMRMPKSYKGVVVSLY